MEGSRIRWRSRYGCGGGIEGCEKLHRSYFSRLERWLREHLERIEGTGGEDRRRSGRRTSNVVESVDKMREQEGESE